MGNTDLKLFLDTSCTCKRRALVVQGGDSVRTACVFVKLG